MTHSPEQILVFDRRGFQGPLFVFGVLLLPLSAGLLWAGWGWGEPVFLNMAIIAAPLGLVAVATRKRVVYEPATKIIRVRYRMLLPIYSRSYNRDDFTSILTSTYDAGGDPLGPGTHLDCEELVLEAKEGKKDLRLYDVTYSALNAWFHHEEKAFRRIADHTQKVLGLPWSNWR